MKITISLQFDDCAPSNVSISIPFDNNNNELLNNIRHSVYDLLHRHINLLFDEAYKNYCNEKENSNTDN